MKKLLIEGANPNATLDDGTLRRPLHFAATHLAPRFAPCVAVLLHCGASPTAQEANGRAPADVATNPHVAKMLICHAKRLEEKAYSAKERRWLLEMELEELQGFVSSKLIWRFLAYRALGVVACQLELELDRSDETPPVGEPVSGETECAARAKHQLELETKWKKGTDATSSGLAKVLAVKQNMADSVASAETDAEQCLGRLVRILKARRALEQQQRQPTNEEEWLQVGDFTLEFKKARAAHEARLEAKKRAEQEAHEIKTGAVAPPKRAASPTGGKRRQRDLHLALDVAAKRDNVRFEPEPFEAPDDEEIPGTFAACAPSSI